MSLTAADDGDDDDDDDGDRFDFRRKKPRILREYRCCPAEVDFCGNNNILASEGSLGNKEDEDSDEDTDDQEDDNEEEGNMDTERDEEEEDLDEKNRREGVRRKILSTGKLSG